MTLNIIIDSKLIEHKVIQYILVFDSIEMKNFKNKPLQYFTCYLRETALFEKKKLLTFYYVMLMVEVLVHKDIVDKSMIPIQIIVRFHFILILFSIY